MSKVYQVIQSVFPNDSAGCDTLLTQRILSGMGLDGGIYAAQTTTEMSYSGEIKNIASLPRINDDDVFIYIHRYGEIPFEKINGSGGKKLLVYHEPVRPEIPKSEYDSPMYKGLRSHYLSAVRANKSFDGAVVFSENGKKDLEVMGYECPVSLRPVMLAEEYYANAANEETPSEMQGNAKNLVYWGKIIPDAHIEDIIAAYACYRRYFNSNSRLILSSDGNVSDEYLRKLKRYAEFLSAEGVVFSLSVSAEKRKVYVRNSDAVICGAGCGEFPEVAAEAVFMDKPVIAWDSSENRLLFKESCKLMENCEPHIAAAFIDRLFSDDCFKNALTAMQRSEADEHSFEKVSGIIESHIRQYIQKCGE